MLPSQVLTCDFRFFRGQQHESSVRDNIDPPHPTSGRHFLAAAERRDFPD
jgi:hypothetical protein